MNRLRRGPKDSGRLAAEPIKGLSRRIIVVESPDKSIFQQAVFVLQDNYLSAEGISRRALLQQARACAEEYLARCVPAGSSVSPLMYITLLSVTTASVLLALKTLEVI